MSALFTHVDFEILFLTLKKLIERDSLLTPTLHNEHILISNGATNVHTSLPIGEFPQVALPKSGTETFTY